MDTESSPFGRKLYCTRKAPFRVRVKESLVQAGRKTTDPLATLDTPARPERLRRAAQGCAHTAVARAATPANADGPVVRQPRQR